MTLAERVLHLCEERKLASSSEKSKYQNIRKQLDALEVEKSRLRDELSSEQDDTKRKAAGEKIDHVKAKIAKLDAVRHDMLKRYRGLRGAA